MTGIQQGLAQEIRKKLNGDNIKLPSLPDTVIKVQQLMASDNYAIKDISDILTQDSAFATVVMRMANSSYFNNTGHEIRSMNTAIQRIGTNSILKLLISVTSRMLFNVRQPELRKIIQATQDHALLAAAAAEQVAHISRAANPADTFMAALLHDQGIDVLVILVPDELQKASSVERENLITMFHREMGARLLHKWSLPEDFILVAQHHGIESSDRPRLSMLDCVDVADAIVQSLENDTEANIAAHPAAQRLRLTQTQLTGIVMDIEDQIETLRQVFAA
ncbi:MAG: hypothetical protein COW19_08565 [Zetaproteobacteria bacterium CG12_big_fil_rev_8_21_14_0_65_55_1124]|nr:MAG: hypothetical protein AUJ58_03460 [Zetaproteobacteria bacterium CG1_02_55_237]PIS19528.1 MAG: hypothetical protein COT53_04865 [Zetaproteobacteria bacterium CG08_land_8_20_14_0_20_55_17]PIW42371.1 MAG: hypothetical protein COW19_08565 [Zetaproteobacteria bacterium CG12_big_fil_rev_8_21_14_0_65_55_1124]PIY52828.1 MAG: hypothetical protein COZ01_06105 [Zetaproteobacteria bacterium CG_4_10_14_0_8_um_filter_55_43]PIZ38034.1 MAG: hypothetical protein COY36_07410 [Zetaproteobacteria bacterium 